MTSQGEYKGYSLQIVQHLANIKGERQSVLFRQDILTGLLQVMSQRHLQALVAWPKNFGGGWANVQTLSNAVFSLLESPFAQSNVPDAGVLHFQKVPKFSSSCIQNACPAFPEGSKVLLLQHSKFRLRTS